MGAVGHNVLSFMDAYLEYNQIPKVEGDKLKEL